MCSLYLSQILSIYILYIFYEYIYICIYIFIKEYIYTYIYREREYIYIYSFLCHLWKTRPKFVLSVIHSYHSYHIILLKVNWLKKKFSVAIFHKRDCSQSLNMRLTYVLTKLILEFGASNLLLRNAARITILGAVHRFAQCRMIRLCARSSRTIRCGSGDHVEKEASGRSPNPVPCRFASNAIEKSPRDRQSSQ